MRKTSFRIILVLAIALLMSCGQSDKATDDPFSAREFVKDPAVVQCDSALNAYVDASGNDYDFDGLKGIFEEYLETYPNSTPLHRSFQDIHFRYDRNDELVERYKSAFESNPNSAMYAYLFGRSACSGRRLNSILVTTGAGTGLRLRSQMSHSVTLPPQSRATGMPSWPIIRSPRHSGSSVGFSRDAMISTPP